MDNNTVSISHREQVLNIGELQLQLARQQLLVEKQTFEMEMKRLEGELNTKRQEDELNMKRREDELNMKRQQDELDMKRQEDELNMKRREDELNMKRREDAVAKREEEVKQLLQEQRQQQQFLPQQHIQILQMDLDTPMSSPFTASDDTSSSLNTSTNDQNGPGCVQEGGAHVAQFKQLKALGRLVQKKYEDCIRREFELTEQLQNERDEFESRVPIFVDSDANGQDVVVCDPKKVVEFVKHHLDYFGHFRIMALLDPAQTITQDQINEILKLNQFQLSSPLMKLKIAMANQLTIDSETLSQLFCWDQEQLYQSRLFLDNVSVLPQNFTVPYYLQLNHETWVNERRGSLSLQFVFEQLGSQGQHQENFYWSSPLIDVLYSQSPSNSGCNIITLPNGSSTQIQPILSSHFRQLYDNNTIPTLTPQLKLFFSTPHVNDGAWVQFHGPGAVVSTDTVSEVNSKLKLLTVGALCPKGTYLPSTSCQVKIKWVPNN